MIRLPLGESSHVTGTLAASHGDGATTELPPRRGDLMDYAVRMVVPLRREFDRAMDVTHFLNDGAYAMGILALAKTSRDARLRAYATFLDLRLLGQALPDQRALPR